MHHFEIVTSIIHVTAWRDSLISTMELYIIAIIVLGLLGEFIPLSSYTLSSFSVSYRKHSANRRNHIFCKDEYDRFKMQLKTIENVSNLKQSKISEPNVTRINEYIDSMNVTSFVHLTDVVSLFTNCHRDDEHYGQCSFSLPDAAETISLLNDETTQDIISKLHRIYLTKKITINQSLYLPVGTINSISSDGIMRNTKDYQERNKFFQLIAFFELFGLTIEKDTAHIVILNAFHNNEINLAEQLFSRFFIHGELEPNQRSLNIMIENFRLRDNLPKSLNYVNMFKTFRNIQPDTYTISSLIRMSQSPDEVSTILSLPSLQSTLTAPAIRCALETLGTLGADPNDIVNISLKYLMHEHSIYKSKRSGDALIVALVQTKMAEQTNLCTHSGLDLALQLCAVGTNVDEPSIDLSTDRVIFSGKGLTTLFAGLQRELRALCARRHYLQLKLKPPNLVSLALNVGYSDSSKIQSEIKNVLLRITRLKKSSRTLERRLVEGQWINVNNEIRLMCPSNVSISSHLQNELDKRHNVAEGCSVIEFNGRLCDAVIRTYLEDPEGARQVWLKTLLPMARRLQNATYTAFPFLLSPEKTNQSQQPIVLEVAEKALDALMFVAGFNGRADIGLEVAKTARSRGLTSAVLIKLAKSYSRGKIERIIMRENGSSLKDDSNTSFLGKSISTIVKVESRSNGNWIEDGLERSIESELGMLLDTNPNKKFPIKNIRFKFTR